MRIGIDDSLEKYLTVAVPIQVQQQEQQQQQEQLAAQSRIGIDPLLLSASYFKQLRSDLQKSTFKHELHAVSSNLVDAVWEGDGRPATPNGKIFALPVEIAGETHASKIERLKAKLAQKQCDYMIVTMLDEIACM